MVNKQFIFKDSVNYLVPEFWFQISLFCLNLKIKTFLNWFQIGKLFKNSHFHKKNSKKSKILQKRNFGKIIFWLQRCDWHIFRSYLVSFFPNFSKIDIILFYNKNMMPKTTFLRTKDLKCRKLGFFKVKYSHNGQNFRDARYFFRSKYWFNIRSS